MAGQEAPSGAGADVAVEHIAIHGQPVAYRRAGSGPLIVLVHGVGESSLVFKQLIPALAEAHAVIAVDLVGHGASAKPRGDYSLGAYANGLRDLLAALGHRSATIVGHSLGGGVAMQFAYQFPERCERLVLVASGGFARHVNPLLRLATAPGAGYLMPLVFNRRLHRVRHATAAALARIGVHPSPVVEEIASSYTALTDGETRRAFIHSLRSVVDVAGQRISAGDRLYLTEDIPTLIVWGDRDAVLPVAQAQAAHELIAGSRLEIFEGCGHLLPVQQPERLAAVIAELMADPTPVTSPPNAGNSS